MIKLFFKLLACVGITYTMSHASNYHILQAYKNNVSDIQVKGVGKVIKVLNDDTKGKSYQKFILRLSKNQIIIIFHDINLSTRVLNLQSGDLVYFHGKYKWSKVGGLVYKTHNSSIIQDKDGWIRHRGKVYR